MKNEKRETKNLWMCSFLDRRTKETYFSNPLIFRISSQTPTLPQRITDKRTTKRTKFRSDFAPKQKKEQKLPTAISPKAKSDSPQKIPSSVSDRKAEKQSTAKRSAGCLSKASSCASDERSFAAGPKLQTAVFLFVTFFFLPPKRKSKSKQ